MTTIVYYRKFSIGACWLRVWFIWSPRRRWCRLFTAVDASEAFVRSWIQTGADAGNSLLWDEPPKVTTEKQFENNERWSFCCCSSHFKQKIIMCISSDINGVAYKVMKCMCLAKEMYVSFSSNPFMDELWYPQSGFFSFVFFFALRAWKTRFDFLNKFFKEIFRGPLEWTACIYSLNWRDTKHKYHNQTDKVCVFNKVINTITSNHVKTEKYMKKIYKSEIL